jgi:hypothetical protein
MKHFSCNIKTIDHRQHRYSTLGDWTFTKSGKFRIRVSKLPDWRYEFLCGIHELIESALCFNKGISPKVVDKFDMSNLDLPEPGENPRAPYYFEHRLAEGIEKLVAHHLKVDWEKYTKAVDKLFKKGA